MIKLANLYFGQTDLYYLVNSSSGYIENLN